MARRLADDAIAREQTEDVLRTEALTIHETNLSDRKGPELYRALNRLDSAALCLSGGGIRSAAFCLGVIQALASHPRSRPLGKDKPGAPCAQADQCLLTKFHYLSTVSGGGYIGSWLSTWRSRAPWADIWPDLTSRSHASNQEAPALDWLRSYSNYLTPKMGLMSADTWAATALFVRNLVLNWIIIIPVFCAIVLTLKLIAIFADWASNADEPVRLSLIGLEFPPWQVAFAVGAVLCLILALSFEVKSLPSQRSSTDTGPDQWRFQRRALLPAYASAVLLAQFLASEDVGTALLVPDTLRPSYSLHIVVLSGAACGAMIYAISWLVAWIEWNPKILRSWSAARGATSRFGARIAANLTYILSWSAAGAVYGSLVALGLYGYIQIPESGIINIHGEALFSSYVFHVVFGLPWIFLSQLTADMIFVGLTDNPRESDADREWLGRAAGWLMAASIGWLVLSFTVFFGAILGPQIVTTETQAAVRSWATTLAGVFGFATAFLGMSSATPAHGPAKDWKATIVNVALLMAAPLFVIALLIGLSFSLDLLLLRTSLVPELFCWWNEDVICWGDQRPPAAEIERLRDLLWLLHMDLHITRSEAVWWLVGGLITFLSLAVGASLFVNINRFSLHAMYRNRLIRAFLGASSKDRNADRFIDFDLKDNPSVHELWPQYRASDWRPFHIINIALNVVSSERLAWQERKAEPFVVTPLHSGSRYLGFRPSKDYGGPNGISLGTAMAISGAAASPNMGYNSSPAVTFLMTMFNVRLGWWLGNPGPRGQRTFRRDGPRCAIKPLIDEAFGLTTDHSAYVYLSDGGHFENLGLYEAVRRRCRFIVAVDAGCDGGFSFADLGNAMRKIHIDLGVKICFVKLEQLKKRTSDGSILTDADYCAIGLIDYIGADGQPESGPPATKDGFILYLKAGYHGTEGGAIRSYANAHPEFPHETTLDQWFSESQFETYRALGFEIADHIITTVLEDHGYTPPRDIAELFEWLWANANAASRKAPVASSPANAPPAHTGQ